MTSAVVGYPIPLPNLPPIYQGDPYPQTGPLRLELKDASNNFVNLTSYGTTWAAWLKLDVDASDLDPVQFAVDASHASSGYLLLTLTATQTATMAARRWVFDVRAAGGSQSPFHVWAGVVDVRGRVTP